MVGGVSVSLRLPCTLVDWDFSADGELVKRGPATLEEHTLHRDALSGKHHGAVLISGAVLFVKLALEVRPVVHDPLPLGEDTFLPFSAILPAISKTVGAEPVLEALGPLPTVDVAIEEVHNTFTVTLVVAPFTLVYTGVAALH